MENQEVNILTGADGEEIKEIEVEEFRDYPEDDDDEFFNRYDRVLINAGTQTADRAEARFRELLLAGNKMVHSNTLNSKTLDCLFHLGIF